MFFPADNEFSGMKLFRISIFFFVIKEIRHDNSFYFTSNPFFFTVIFNSVQERRTDFLRFFFKFHHGIKFKKIYVIL